MYEQEAEEELRRWRRMLSRKESIIKSRASTLQKRVNDKLPTIYHDVATTCVQKTVEMIIAGVGFTNRVPQERPLSLEERELKTRKMFAMYRRAAIVEGIGTGAGGVIAGLTDFPLLLTLKMKALFEAAAIYGYSTKEQCEREYLLLIFQLAFSTGEMKNSVLETIDAFSKEGVSHLDWHAWQMNYRDYIDLPKTLQLVPGFGAFIGGFVNRSLFYQLEETTINVYRLRWLSELRQIDK
ncbi:EcsC family protein [Bacillus sp. JCM 19041]|uniref:EcsC family protein n=1 Tax=Bacillus sp. JCM 19041 TaxID=1460637 RepID=UPI0006D1152C